MIWPFKSKEDRAAAFIGDFDAAVDLCAEKWVYFTKTLAFKESVPLRDRISMFFIPMSQGLGSSFSSMKKAPDPALLMAVTYGVHRSGTHTKREIEEAMGVTLVDAE